MKSWLSRIGSAFITGIALLVLLALISCVAGAVLKLFIKAAWFGWNLF